MVTPHDDDPLLDWISECCDRGKYFTSANQCLFASWSAWDARHLRLEWSTKRFSMEMASRGFTRKRSAGTRLFSGVRLTRDRPPSPFLGEGSAAVFP